MGFAEFLFETKKGKKIMAFIYGMGASVVIVGALFKIMHWPF
jgi:3-hydroxy-3-methylglutaryl CoA synthase